MSLIQSKAHLAGLFDHTILKPDASQKQVDQLCDEARESQFFGVCVNSCYIERAAKRLAGSKVVPLAVVGFPLGAMVTRAKVEETKISINLGAQEIDTVVNLGVYFSGDVSDVAKDIREVVKASGKVPVKVILETGFLQPDQIKELTTISLKEGAAFVKTSTGFGPRGASVEDIELMRQVIDSQKLTGKIGIKASGGIRELAFVEKLVAAGATRIGASASVNILKEFK